jgi:hypothetical protein
LRSTAAFIALVAFALVNTAFLGFYLTQSGSGTTEVSGTTATTSLSAVQSQLTAVTTTMVPTSNTAAAVTASTTGATTTATVSSITTTTTGASTSTPSPTQTISGTSTSGSSTETTSQNGLGYAVGTTTQTSSGTASSTVTSSNTSQSSSLIINSAQTSSTGQGKTSNSPSLLTSIVSFFEEHSLILAPSSWFAVGGMWIWRGRMRSKWTDLGFDSDVFTLFVKMKGAKTRIRLLDALTVPKDRLQLADELGLDWKSVDRHVAVMKKYGFVNDSVAYGRVRLYQLTPMGVSLLKLLQELSREDRREDTSSPAVVEREA